MLQKLEHIGVMVTDMDRSIAFYTEVLGLKLRDRRRLGDVVELAFLGLDGAELELVAGAPAEVSGDAQVNHIAFAVESLPEAMEAIRHSDPAITFTEAMPLWEGKGCVFFRGPDGERLELFGRL